jgi:hypothetical protein
VSLANCPYCSAKVTFVRGGSNGRVLTRESAKIACEFSDAQGRVVQGKGKNLAANVQEGMYIPIFYDPNNLADRVALCESWYEIATPRAGKRVT